ncbi:MAG: hypothetical protein WC312_03900 [Candidatus Omnitrophota bacterium]|jgi:hypothetical protein
MNIRQQKYKYNRLVLKLNQTDAALEAGYSFNYATKRSKKLEEVVTADMKDIFERLGYSDYQIAKRFIDKANCKRPIGATILVDKEGKLIRAEDEGCIEVDDNNVQLKALEDIAEMTGCKKNKIEHSGAIQHNVFFEEIVSKAIPNRITERVNQN